MEPKGPIFQDDNFIFTDFDNQQLEKLIICENPETKEPLIVYLKVKNKDWHQFFLDAGYGFCENWGEPEIDESYDYSDKTDEFNLFEKVISKIWCEPQQNNSQIIIQFKSYEKLILRTVQPEIFDSKSELLIKK